MEEQPPQYGLTKTSCDFRRLDLLGDVWARAKSIIIEGLFFRIDPNRAFSSGSNLTREGT